MNWPGFIGPSSQPQASVADCERSVNLYLEPNDTRSGRPALYPTPGQTPFAGMASGITDIGTRALATMNARSFAVIGFSVYELFQDGTVINRGAVAQDSNPAQAAFNGISGNQAAFSSGGNLYVLNLATNVLSAALLPGEVTQAGMIDGYGVWFNRTLGKLRLSNLNDFTTNDPTQFALRSAAPDNWIAMLINAPDIFLIGEQSGDVWYDAGVSPFPLAPRPGASFPYGIVAPFSLASAGDSVLWLSRNAQGAGILVRARGYTPIPVGSFAFNTAVKGYLRDSRIDDAESMVLQWGGHVLYVLRFPSPNATWCYDLTTGAMFEWLRWNSANNRFDALHSRVTALAFGKHLVGESATGVISYLDDTVGTEADGSPIVRLRIPPALMAAEEHRMRIARFELLLEHGLGTVSDQGADPQAMLRMSGDFAKTWGNERTASLGKIGEFDKRTYWLQCGSSETSLVPEIRISDPVPVRIVGATAQVTGAEGQQ